MKLRTVFTAAFVACAVVTVAWADPAFLARARGYVGPEAVLNAVESVRYEGLLTSRETPPDGPVRSSQAEIEIIFQKPLQQRIVARGGGKLEMTALDGYDGWQRVEDPSRPAVWRMNLLGKEQVKRLRANTWENLAFYQSPAPVGGRIEDRGTVEVEGHPARCVAFVHAEDIVFTRFFDPETGRLLLTRTEQGALIREEGELRVGGLRFPQRLRTDARLADGTRREVTIEFTAITVNERFGSELFAVPTPGTLAPP